MKLLVVEDNPAEARLMREMLREAPPDSVELKTADRLATALESIREDPPDVVLLDLGLPDSQGLITLQKALAAFPDMPFVVLTGLNDEDFALEAVRTGAQDYLVKGQISCDGLVRTARYAIERHHNRKALKDSEARKGAILRSALDAIITIDEKRRVLEFNPAAELMLGFEAADVVGKVRVDAFLPSAFGLPTRDADAPPTPALGRLVELTARRRDGSEFPAELAVTRVDQDAPPMFTCFLRDISERKQAEARIHRMNEELEARVHQRTAQLAQANKELESFSYSVSHDLRAPLRHIHGYVEMLTANTAGQLAEKPKRYLRIITEASIEMGQLIDGLLAFSRMSRVELQTRPCDLNSLVQDTIRNLEMTIKDRNICWNIDALPPVLGDATTLKQVLANLIGNAVKYSSKKDPAEIEIGTINGEDNRVTLFVRDNGAGFDMKYAHKLFGVFQRLHRAEEFEGTGIGLATVHRILARHGGRIWAEAKTGEGATFYFTLKPSGTDNDGTTSAPSPEQALTILH